METLVVADQENISQSTSHTDPLSSHETADRIRSGQRLTETGAEQPVTPSNAGTVNRGPFQGYRHEDDEFEKSPWARKVVLSFDGGGVRGYSSLLILDCLMQRVQELEKTAGFTNSSHYPWMEVSTQRLNDGSSPGSAVFLPCHYFDYIAGTSTGGLSAIMLARLRMSTSKALETYKYFGQSVFGKARLFHERSWWWYGRAKYASQNIVNALVEVIQQNIPGATPDAAKEESFNSPQHKSRTIVFSVCAGDGVTTPHIWRTYDHEKNVNENTLQYMNFGPGDRVPIWQVARATSAAPFFFEEMKIRGKEHRDGALGMNNPALRVFQEIRHKEHHPPSLFISIGTGIKREEEAGKKSKKKTGKKRGIFKRYKDLSHVVENQTTETEITNHDWASTCDDNETKSYRFNVSHGLGSIPLDDWRPVESGTMTLNDIIRYTEEYLKKEDTRQQINQCAELLVKARHSRAETERWETFATDIEYYCPFCAYKKCKEGDARHYRDQGCRNKLREHLRNVHADDLKHDPGDLGACIDAGRLSPGPRSNAHEKTKEKMKETVSNGLRTILDGGERT